MKIIYQKIWKLALPYQDTRDDKGHAKIVVAFATKLLKKEGAEEEIIIPAAILHDIGWSRLSKKERFSIFQPEKLNSSKMFSGDPKIRIKHQKESVKLAKHILREVKYDKNFVPKVLEIISEHDTRIGFISKDEGIMRDADKLWQFSRTGFLADGRRRKISNSENIIRMTEKLNRKGFFYSKTSKKMASEELKKRKKEFRL